MSYPQMKSPTKAEIEHHEKKKQGKQILRDVDAINKVISDKKMDEYKSVHMMMDGKYGAYVPDWGKGMYGYNPDFGFNYELIGESSLEHNLILMSSKLQGHAMGLEQPRKTNYHPINKVNVSVNNTNEVNITISFEQARQQIEDMTSLTDKEAEEILAKITELEEIINSKNKKRTKWEQAKGILIWLADKSCDVGMTLLPLLLKIQG